MALYTRAQFADACGVNTNYINTYVGRRKIIVSGDYIDDSIQQNRDFLLKMQAKKPPVATAEPEKKSSRARELSLEEPDLSLLSEKKTTRKSSRSDKEEDASSRYKLDLKKLEIEIKKKEEEVEKLRTYNAKQAGELVPIELVTQLVKVHNQSMLSTQETIIESVLIMFSGDFKLTDAQTADIRGKLKRLLNEGLDRAIENTKKSIMSIVEEFSSLRGVGDHA